MIIHSVQKAKRRPSWVDVTAPKVMRDDHAIAAKFEVNFTRAFLKLSRSMYTEDAKKRVVRALTEGRATIEEVVQQIDWWNPNDPMAVRQWRLFANGLNNAYTKITEAAGNAAYKEIGMHRRIRFEVMKAIAVPVNPYTQRWIDEHVGDLIVDISTKQQELVRETVREGLEIGMRSEAIGERIEQIVGLTRREAGAVIRRERTILEETGSESAARRGADSYAKKLLVERGRRIARTETREALSQGQIDAWKVARDNGALSPDVEKEWVSMPPSPRQSEICADTNLDGQRRPLDEPFDTIVGPVMRPPAHPNCRSVMKLVFPDDQPLVQMPSEEDIEPIEEPIEPPPQPIEPTPSVLQEAAPRRRRARPVLGRFGSKEETYRSMLESVQGADIPADFVAADQRYVDWKKGRGPKPPAWDGGELDSVNEALDLRGDKRVSSAREAWDKLTSGVRSWNDPQVLDAVQIMREVPGFERLEIPENVRAWMIQQEAERLAREEEEEFAAAVEDLDDSFDFGANVQETDDEEDLDDSFDFGANL